jgi:hypothetical protein
MGNITDSLDIIYDEATELEHDCDAMIGVVHQALDPLSPVAPEAGRAVQTVQARIHYLVARIDQERRLMAELAQMVRSLRCANCLRWFEVIPSPGRAPEYCSPACRTAAYRARKQASDLLTPPTVS